MNKYENVVIVDPKLDEENLNKTIDRFTKLINKHGKVLSTDNSGLKKLAYEIEKNKEAYYVTFVFESEPDFIEELQRNYRISDEILKFLVIKLDDEEAEQAIQVEKKPKKAEVKEAKKEETTEEVAEEQPVEETEKEKEEKK